MDIEYRKAKKNQREWLELELKKIKEDLVVEVNVVEDTVLKRTYF